MHGKQQCLDFGAQVWEIPSTTFSPSTSRISVTQCFSGSNSKWLQGQNWHISHLWQIIHIHWASLLSMWIAVHEIFLRWTAVREVLYWSQGGELLVVVFISSSLQFFNSTGLSLVNSLIKGAAHLNSVPRWSGGQIWCGKNRALGKQELQHLLAGIS